MPKPSKREGYTKFQLADKSRQIIKRNIADDVHSFFQLILLNKTFNLISVFCMASYNDKMNLFRKHRQCLYRRKGILSFFNTSYVEDIVFR